MRGSQEVTGQIGCQSEQALSRAPGQPLAAWAALGNLCSNMIIQSIQIYVNTYRQNTDKYRPQAWGCWGPGPSQVQRLATGRATKTNWPSHRMFCWYLSLLPFPWPGTEAVTGHAGWPDLSVLFSVLKSSLSFSVFWSAANLKFGWVSIMIRAWGCLCKGTTVTGCWLNVTEPWWKPSVDYFQGKIRQYWASTSQLAIKMHG